MLRWSRSIPTAGSIGEFIALRYGLPVRSCVLLRSLANDVYEVGTDTRKYVFKLYHAGGWSPGEVAWEQEFVEYVRAAGIPCAKPVRLRDGALCGQLDAPEGSRPFALTEFVEGTKPRPPLDQSTGTEFGRLTGRFHEAGLGFRSKLPRRRFDLAEILDRPLQEVRPQLGDRTATITELARHARERIAAAAPEWGVCHGDVSLDNIHCTPAGIVLHDFDLTAPGYLGADLTGVRLSRHWSDFAAGYRQIRPLPDLSVLPWLQVCMLIRNLHFHLVDKPVHRGTESRAEGWAEREFAALDALSEELLSRPD